MNERIQQLVEQAGPNTQEELNNMDRTNVHVIDVKKFAELLMLECVNAVMDGTKEGDHYAMRIEQHFDNGPGGILHFGVE